MNHPGFNRKRREEPEFQHQSALFTWARNPAVLAQYPALDLLSCSLNGVKLTASQAGKAKASGMLKGEFDIKLPVARGGWIGLIIEMKAGKNKPTPEQVWYSHRMTQEGHRATVCWTWEAAQQEILHYLHAGTGSKLQPLEKNHE